MNQQMSGEAVSEITSTSERRTDRSRKTQLSNNVCQGSGALREGKDEVSSLGLPRLRIIEARRNGGAKS